jgi:hypothetical protein
MCDCGSPFHIYDRSDEAAISRRSLFKATAAVAGGASLFTQGRAAAQAPAVARPPRRASTTRPRA